MQKQLEATFKTINPKVSKSDISAVEPLKYCRRFNRFIEHEVLKQERLEDQMKETLVNESVNCFETFVNSINFTGKTIDVNTQSLGDSLIFYEEKSYESTTRFLGRN